ncbi:uncharacterized protein ARMOST_10014 [Armillaria ostoyae]|uniref:Protein kinase domain-containing protein n=1 Tax=Armillaria ostoyae TaxID=47428 RepID=A0A284RD41_ARMOS|nr:uncharacterized protein ARMOST_10014 [Armillaria ostoyae]
MAPEVLDGHDIRADVWSLGMAILEMLSGGHPWVKVKKRMVDTIMAFQMPQLPNNIQVSPELNILLKRIFVPAKDRPYLLGFTQGSLVSAREHVVH